ncbi:hypothetical protein [Ruegeria lacuscaerulensis]|uniref:hypothetical protein n=1 Tax=Ruegeria lacuscaerulensis TaxID=55218 RepID=UPI00147F8667|nr:hypothetical protein [Ruegeria lacuscaerulensis]
MFRKFQSESDFRDAIEAELSKRNMSNAFSEGVVLGIIEAEADIRQEPPRVDPSGMRLRIGTWFIRDDDIPVFDAFTALGGLVVTAMAGTAIAPAAALTSGTSIARAIWQVWRKGGRLSTDQMKVLCLLAARGPSSPDEITEIDDVHLKAHDAAGTANLLQTLTEVELRDGSVVALVRQNPDGTWRKLNV